MAFKKMDKTAFPPRQWALVGHPGSGKSTFAAQMRGPLLVVDADHRFTEVAGKTTEEVYELSENPADHINAERIAILLRENMADSGVRTVIVDSLTSILSPLVVEAILDNEAGRNKNRVSAFKDKALAMRLLQDTITGWGCDVLWIYHLRAGLDSQAVQRETTSISAVELARLRRSLNMQLRIVQEGDQRGIHVEWARRGRSGITLWDESDHWKNMPEKLEQAVYGGLTPEQMKALEKQTPLSFSGPKRQLRGAMSKDASTTLCMLTMPMTSSSGTGSQSTLRKCGSYGSSK
jgi:energy-coupling factor transporter ATP-binding protein EcfA2